MIHKYVLGFARTKAGVLLILKTHPDFQKGKFNGVGGKIEEGETPLQAMIREFLEETGIATQAYEWISNGEVCQNNYRIFIFETILTDEKVTGIVKVETIEQLSCINYNQDTEVVYHINKKLIMDLSSQGKLVANVLAYSYASSK